MTCADMDHVILIGSAGRGTSLGPTTVGILIDPGIITYPLVLPVPVLGFLRSLTMYAEGTDILSLAATCKSSIGLITA
jgi:hypothetical protein